jgi:outer membrane protein assembly factor BamB
MKNLVLLTALTVVLRVVPAMTEQWPQWRGPMLNGVSAEKNLPVRWSTTQNVTWKLAMTQESGSTPIVWGEHVFLSAGEGGELSLWAVDRNRGSIRWKRSLGGGNRRMMKQQM